MFKIQKLQSTILLLLFFFHILIAILSFITALYAIIILSLFLLDLGVIRRQIANPARPTRTLTSFTRGVRRGDLFSSTLT